MLGRAVKERAVAAAALALEADVTLPSNPRFHARTR
jgi:hypothetical protein